MSKDIPLRLSYNSHNELVGPFGSLMLEPICINWQYPHPPLFNFPMHLQGSFQNSPINSLWTRRSFKVLVLRYVIEGVSERKGFKDGSIPNRCKCLDIICLIILCFVYLVIILNVSGCDSFDFVESFLSKSKLCLERLVAFLLAFFQTD